MTTVTDRLPVIFFGGEAGFKEKHLCKKPVFSKPLLRCDKRERGREERSIIK